MRREVQILDTLVAMQRHADCVRRGYRWWTGGTVELARVLRLARRFEALYEVNLHRNTRRRRRKTGEGVALLLLYRLPGRSQYGQANATLSHIGWTLLVTDGECSVRHREVLRDGTQRTTRLAIGQYELVRLSRPSQCTAAWSYRMSPQYYQAWRERVIRSARGDPAELPVRVLAELYREPGFAGVRSQVGHICALYRREWRRRRTVRDAFPRLPRLAYVQRLPTTATPLTELLERTARMAALAEDFRPGSPRSSGAGRRREHHLTAQPFASPREEAGSHERRPRDDVTVHPTADRPGCRDQASTVNAVTTPGAVPNGALDENPL